MTNLELSTGELSPAFDPELLDYIAAVPSETALITVTATTEFSEARLSVNGVPVTAGQPTAPLDLAFGDNLLEILATGREDASRTYRVTVHRGISEVAYAKASNTEGGDVFGFSVALSHDTLVVGAPGEDGDGASETSDAAPNSGAVYVFTRRGSNWSPAAYLKASNPDAGDRFGTSVAIHGDTLFVGAPGEDSDGTSQTDDTAVNSGAVYVFSRTGSSWAQGAYLKAENAESEDGFGRAVALSGETAVVGAAGEDGDGTSATSNDASDSGAAYVFTRSATDWIQQAYLKSRTATAGSEFGTSVAIDGDTVVVGAPNDAISGEQNGAAYIFERTGANWEQSQEFAPSSALTRVGDQMGLSVAIDGDIVAVGAPGDNSSTRDRPESNDTFEAGAVYLLVRVGGTWLQPQYLKPNIPEFGDRFGESVSVRGNTVVIGASGERSDGTSEADNSLEGAGAVYLFRSSGTLWSQIAYLKASNTDRFDGFGRSVAVDGDTFVASSPREDSPAVGLGGNQGNVSSGFNSGAAYVFFGQP